MIRFGCCVFSFGRYFCVVFIMLFMVIWFLSFCLFYCRIGGGVKLMMFIFSGIVSLLLFGV